MIINFWQNILSPHQSACIRALTAMGHKVHLIAEQETLPERKAMGWELPCFGDTRISIAPSLSEINSIITDGTSNGAVNIISGTRGRFVEPLLSMCLHQKAKTGLLAESGDPHGLSGSLRRLIYLKEALRWRNTVDFTLAMGQIGVDWYIAAGYPPSRVFHCAYTVETPIVFDSTPRPNSRMQMVFVGALIRRKGLDILFRALSLLKGQDWHLSIIGDGPEHDSLKQIASRFGIDGQISFLGTLAMAEVSKQIALSDLLILPSRFDGWGAVVNEALMGGTPVVCSKHCGAADLLCSPRLGVAFTTGSETSLAQVLLSRIEQMPSLPASEREWIRSWAQCIDGDTMANYLSAIINHIYSGGQRPTPPWHAPIAGE